MRQVELDIHGLKAQQPHMATKEDLLGAGNRIGQKISDVKTTLAELLERVGAAESRIPADAQRAGSRGNVLPKTGERALLCRLASRRFGAETGERLSGLLGRLTDPERLAEVGDQVIECGTGAELLDRAGRLARLS